MTTLNVKLTFIIILITVSNSILHAQDFVFKCDGIYQTNEKGVRILNADGNSMTDAPDSYLVDTIPIVCFQDFKKVRLGKEHITNIPILRIELNNNMKDKFSYATAQNISKPLPLIFENKLISAPIIYEEIKKGKIDLSGLDEETILKIIEKVNK